MHLFDSYAEAAVICYEAGLLSRAAAARVIDAVTVQLGAVTFANERQRLARLEEFQRAVGRFEAACARRAADSA